MMCMYVCVSVGGCHVGNIIVKMISIRHVYGLLLYGLLPVEEARTIQAMSSIRM